jgi:hypothetical protein
MKKLLSFDFSALRKYFSEKNALTAMTSLFCLVMTVVGIVKEDIWLTLGFALAFSFSMEVMSHRIRENK